MTRGNATFRGNPEPGFPRTPSAARGRGKTPSAARSPKAALSAAGESRTNRLLPQDSEYSRPRRPQR